MCGGSISLKPDSRVATCEYCGSMMTLPRLDTEKRKNLYERADHYLREGEYDKAATLYENILIDDESDAEAYWDLVLCRYGIEYIEDLATGKRVPTCNRTHVTSVFQYRNYQAALRHADLESRAVYEKEAVLIDSIRRKILDISSQEDPYDIFICYKDTDSSGRRTPDSILAQDLYYELKEQGFRVFYSRITLEDKAGTEYEPYIFAALNTAKIMIVLGTRSEYFDAVWVKNEWSRFLNVMQDNPDRTMIPAYRDMNVTDLPEELSHLQALDMGKLGFMKDLIHGIRKLTGVEEERAAKHSTMVIQEGADADSLLERAFLLFEDGEWLRADDLLEKALNMEPHNPRAYIGKVMIEIQVRKEVELLSSSICLSQNKSFKRALRFAEEEDYHLEELYVVYEEYNKEFYQCPQETRERVIYSKAMELQKDQTESDMLWRAYLLFSSISNFTDAQEWADKCKNHKDELDYREQSRLYEEHMNQQNSIGFGEGCSMVIVIILMILGVISMFSQLS